ncbi:MAG: hypothetical protein JRG96_07225 [Deltaproteobacteria bacterium]|nr:hypothetical protein [Deltaproteobacteria bacterium]MBW2421735.1 hypothetical protein [Deltaproteobacteria bacterium]
MSTTGLSLILACVCVLAAGPALALTMANLNDGDSFTTAAGLTYFDFSIDSSTSLMLSDITIDILDDGFQYQVTAPSDGNGYLSLAYSVSGLGPGELTPTQNFTAPSSKKKAAKKKAARSALQIYGSNPGSDPAAFAASGSYFVDEDEGWVHYLGLEGEVAEGYFQYDAFAAAKKKAAKKKAGPDTGLEADAFIESELSLFGSGDVVARERHSVSAIPEPMGAGLFGVGLLVVAGALRRRRAH